MTKRDVLAFGAAGVIVPPGLAYGQAAKVSATTPASPQWISTSREAQWLDQSSSLTLREGWHGDVMVKTDDPHQVIDGFGACFNELGWDALNALDDTSRAGIFQDLFAPRFSDHHGLGFSHCRMPIGANDFARDWYSHNETADDFEMEAFSIDRDRSSLIPFIRSAQAVQPGLRVWASPWSPPSWMKTNGHYAQRPDARVNDLANDQAVPEGSTGFILEEAYLQAYALYFRKFVEAYRTEGINIGMVMPQNEFNSDQAFPSCVWTPEALAEFVTHLAPEMEQVDVQIALGTIERPDPELIHRFMTNSDAAQAIMGLGFQWAGRHAAASLHERYPDLKVFQTEQECGDGLNDWRFARHSWRMMKDFMRAGTSTYNYWNIALLEGQTSSWGWRQNSLVVVDPQTRRYRFTPDYFTLKHVSHFVQDGARRVTAHTWTGYENSLAFVNPDGSEVMVIGNDMPEPIPVDVGIMGGIAHATLSANSLNTIFVPRRS